MNTLRAVIDNWKAVKAEVNQATEELQRKIKLLETEIYEERKRLDAISFNLKFWCINVNQLSDRVTSPDGMIYDLKTTYVMDDDRYESCWFGNGDSQVMDIGEIDDISMRNARDMHAKCIERIKNGDM